MDGDGRQHGGRIYTVVPVLVLAGASLASRSNSAAVAVALVGLPLSLLFAGSSTLCFLRHQDPAGPEDSLIPRRVSSPNLVGQV